MNYWLIKCLYDVLRWMHSIISEPLGIPICSSAALLQVFVRFSFCPNGCLVLFHLYLFHSGSYLLSCSFESWQGRTEFRAPTSSIWIHFLLLCWTAFAVAVWCFVFRSKLCCVRGTSLIPANSLLHWLSICFGFFSLDILTTLYLIIMRYGVIWAIW